MLGQSIGKYRIMRQIGQGGMGAVYEAVHEGIGQRVAIKVLHPAYSAQPEIVNRFFNEARAVHIVRHPGLVKTFDFGQFPDGTTYMVMEFLEGQPLTARLRHTGGGLPLGDALRIGRQVASALLATHKEGIVHRDLKPDNIFLVIDPETPGGERAKLLDFGIAKLRVEAGDGQAGPQARTATGALMGTPMYMSPEQCRGAGGVDDRTDVYALGLILYEMLAGQPPFTGHDPGHLIVMHLTQAPPPLKQAAPGVPAGVVELIHRMLVKTATERPAIGEVVTELERLGAERAHAGPEVTRHASGPMGALPSAPSTLRAATGMKLPLVRSRWSWAGALVLLVGMGTVGWALLHSTDPHKDRSTVTAPAVQPERISSPVAPPPDGGAPLSVPDRPATAAPAPLSPPPRHNLRRAAVKPTVKKPSKPGPADEDYFPRAVD